MTTVLALLVLGKEEAVADKETVVAVVKNMPPREKYVLRMRQTISRIRQMYLRRRS